MKNVMGIIYTNKDDLSLRELTNQRSVAALPLAGRYRVVDFILSSMVNSGVRNVGVIMQRNYRSLMDHLGSGKEWDLHTRNNALFLLPPFVTPGKRRRIPGRPGRAARQFRLSAPLQAALGPAHQQQHGLQHEL